MILSYQGWGLNYSTLFLILLTLVSGLFAVGEIWRAYTTFSLNYLRSFSFRVAADLALTMTWSILYLVGIPLYNVDSWQHGEVLLGSLYGTGVICIFVATECQLATSLSLVSSRLLCRLQVLYTVIVVVLGGLVGIAVVASSVRPSRLIDQGMLAFAVLSRTFSLGSSAPLIAASRHRNGKVARRALRFAGCFFILIDASWLVLYGLGAADLLPARLYDGLHLTRMLLLNVAVIVFLDRFLNSFEGAPGSGPAEQRLDPYLVTKYGITQREQEIIQHLRTGSSNEEIAGKLFISTRTVKGHLYRIFQKTKVKNRVQLVNLFSDRRLSSVQTTETND